MPRASTASANDFSNTFDDDDDDDAGRVDVVVVVDDVEGGVSPITSGATPLATFAFKNKVKVNTKIPTFIN